jgi:5-carboxymethyl-2-hydroxymuconate isomerase
MPHCTIEYVEELEEELDPMLMIGAVHNGAVASGLFNESHIKSRAVPYQHYKTGTGELRFIHITAKVLSGRSNEQKSSLSQHLLEHFKLLLIDKALTAITLTVEVRDMDKEAYSKAVF